MLIELREEKISDTVPFVFGDGGVRAEGGGGGERNFFFFLLFRL